MCRTLADALSDDPVSGPAFQKPRQEGHEGNEGHEENQKGDSTMNRADETDQNGSPRPARQSATQFAREMNTDGRSQRSVLIRSHPFNPLLIAVRVRRRDARTPP